MEAQAWRGFFFFFLKTSKPTSASASARKCVACTSLHLLGLMLYLQSSHLNCMWWGAKSVVLWRGCTGYEILLTAAIAFLKSKYFHMVHLFGRNAIFKRAQWMNALLWFHPPKPSEPSSLPTLGLLMTCKKCKFHKCFFLLKGCIVYPHMPGFKSERLFQWLVRTKSLFYLLIY